MSQQQRYPVLRTKVEPSSEIYRANYEANLAAWTEVEEAQGTANLGGGEKYTQTPSQTWTHSSS